MTALFIVLTVAGFVLLFLCYAVASQMPAPSQSTGFSGPIYLGLGMMVVGVFGSGYQFVTWLF